MIKLGEPVVLDLHIHSEANVFPIVPPGGSNHRTEGVGMSTIPNNRNYSDYLEEVHSAPVNKISGLNKASKAKIKGVI